MDAAAIASAVLAAVDGGRQVGPFTSKDPGFSEADAYEVTARLRALRIARGEKPVGRKIGFTNRNIWAEYGVFQPIWGDMYDTTVRDVAAGDRVEVSHLPEPRIEAEIVLGLGRDLEPDMGIAEIAQSIAWVAHGFEFVQSIFPAWRFQAADCVADGGLHGRLFLGARRETFGRRAPHAGSRTFPDCTSGSAGTASRSTPGRAPMCWTGRSRRWRIWSRCSEKTSSIRRSGPARSSRRGR